MTDTDLNQLATQVGDALKRLRLVLATAESCTGGWVAKCVTDIPGSSAWFDRGFVTYTNQSKQDMLGVLPTTLSQSGAVSEQTACAMVEGALQQSQADIALAITGIAGPGGGSLEKPVGTVWVAWGKRNQPVDSDVYHFQGNRLQIRQQAVAVALQGILDRLCE